MSVNKQQSDRVPILRTVGWRNTHACFRSVSVHVTLNRTSSIKRGSSSLGSRRSEPDPVQFYLNASDLFLLRLFLQPEGRFVFTGKMKTSCNENIRQYGPVLDRFWTGSYLDAGAKAGQGLRGSGRALEAGEIPQVDGDAELRPFGRLRPPLTVQ